MKLFQFKDDVVFSDKLLDLIGRGEIGCKGPRRSINCDNCVFYSNICDGVRFYTDSKKNFKDSVKF